MSSFAGFLVFAHPGHWLVDLLYLAPMLVLAATIGLGKLKERRRGGDPPDPPVK